MTTMAERRAAAAARIKTLTAPIAGTTPAKPRIKVRANGVLTELAIKLALGIQTTAQKMVRWAESKASQHVDGGVCPHCHGTGRYRFHTDATRNEKCYRCHGKGRLDTRDLAFLAKRVEGTAPVCWVSTAAAA